MALPAGIRRHLQVDVRAKIGTGGKTGAKALHDYVHEVSNVTSRKIANQFREYIRYYHSVFVADAKMITQTNPVLREVLMRHSSFKGGSTTNGIRPQAWVYARLFNPLGTMSTAMHLSYKQLKDGSTKVYIRGADIKFQEYGTGWIGEHIESHPNTTEAGWAYNKGASIKTDEPTGIKYWVYGQYARVGSPAGHFYYDAAEHIKRDIKSKHLGAASFDFQSQTKELISAVFASTLGR